MWCRVWQHLSTPSCCFCGGGRSRGFQYGSQYGFSASSHQGRRLSQSRVWSHAQFSPAFSWKKIRNLMKEIYFLSLRQNIVSTRFNPLSLGAPIQEKHDTCSIQQGSCWECSQHHVWGQPTCWSWQSLWTDGCNNFALCGCRCFYPSNSLGR